MILRALTLKQSRGSRTPSIRIIFSVDRNYRFVSHKLRTVQLSHSSDDEYRYAVFEITNITKRRCSHNRNPGTRESSSLRSGVTALRQAHASSIKKFVLSYETRFSIRTDWYSYVSVIIILNMIGPNLDPVVSISTGLNNFIFYIAEVLHWLPYLVFILIIITVIISIVAYPNCSIVMAGGNTLPDRRAIFFTLFEDRMRREFPMQSPETMSTLVTAFSHILRPKPERPSVILFLTRPGAFATCARMMRNAVSVINASLKRKCYDGVERVSLSCSKYGTPEDFWEFFEDLSDRMNREKVVVLADFQEIHPQAATALYHLVDDTYSPYPQSIVLINLDIGNRFKASQFTRGAAINLAETYLKERWGSRIDAALLTELLNRLTGRSILIEKETTYPRNSTKLLMTNSLSSLK